MSNIPSLETRLRPVAGFLAICAFLWLRAGCWKTTLVKTLARSLECSFSRIQFTPDLLPSDVQMLCPSVLNHRVHISPQIRLRGHTPSEVIHEIVESVPVPVVD